MQEKNGFIIYKKNLQAERDRLHELFTFLNNHEELESVFIYLKNTYPNTEKENEQERINRVVSVRGGFPKLPPNYVARKNLVSIKNPFFYLPQYWVYDSSDNYVMFFVLVPLLSASCFYLKKISDSASHFLNHILRNQTVVIL